MLKRLQAALAARSTVLSLLVLLATAMTVAALVPQKGRPELSGALSAGEAGVSVGPFVQALGADHVFSTAWFALLALLFITSLALSSLDQLRLARARTWRAPAESDGDGTPSLLTAAEVGAILRGEGYRRLSAVGDRARHVRHWQGYWGNFLLHAGMTLTVLFAVTYVVTEHRVLLLVVSGRPSVLTASSHPELRGLLARDLPLPAEVSLYRVEPTFGANDQLVDLASQLVFTDPQGASRELRVAVNDYQDYRGITVYQVVKYGHAFFLEASDGSGASDELMVKMPFPEKRGAASYANEPLRGGRVLKAKYFASADRTQLLSDAPQLVLRLQEGERLLGEATLQAGQTAQLGPAAVRLARVGWWTEILFEGSLGVFGIFAGFGVLVAGAFLIFFAIPREVVVGPAGAGCTVQWRSPRLPELYWDERDRLLLRITGGRAS
jgi:preprotein translocase subunit SecG